MNTPNKNELGFVPDFLEFVVGETKKNKYVVYSDFNFIKNNDIVIKGGTVTGWWNGEKWTLGYKGLFEYIDNLILSYTSSVKSLNPGINATPHLIQHHSSGAMKRFDDFVNRFKTEDDKIFNNNIFFLSDEVKKEDYSTYKLPYNPTQGETAAFSELFNVLYDKEELDKILWAMGALLTGSMPDIHKFLFIYGPKGSGKSTILKVLELIIGDYQAPIDLRGFTSSSEFATADVKEVPVLMDTDSDLSKITNEQNLLKLTAHEPVIIRKLYKQGYPVIFNGLLITASNERFKLHNADSGITRRALVVSPTRNKVDYTRYKQLMNSIKFEVPQIAQLCIDKFNDMGADYYAEDVDTNIIEYSDKVFKFLREYYEELEHGVSFKQATSMFESFLEDIGWNTTGVKRKLESDLTLYFNKFEDKHEMPDGSIVRNWYSDLNREKVFPELLKDKHKKSREEKKKLPAINLAEHNKEDNVFDVEYHDVPAQYATEDGIPMRKWDNCTTVLSDLDPTRLHYVRVPYNHIVIDFDLKNDKGEKDLSMNLAKASLYPKTYIEVSKSGGGIHLHYIYDGNVEDLANEIEPGIEIKKFTGHTSLRRKYTKSNNEFIAHISSGLPLRKDKQVFKDVEDIVWTSASLRGFVEKCLAKEHHNATKPEVDFIAKVMKDAEEQGLKYDLSDIKYKVKDFAMNSSHQRENAFKVWASINWKTIEEEPVTQSKSLFVPEEDIYFYDLEVYPNLNILCFKRYDGTLSEDPKIAHKQLFDSIPEEVWESCESWTSPDNNVGVWYNPTPAMCASIMNKARVGFNNRDYDAHIFYDIYCGKKPVEIFNQSQMIIDGPRDKNPGRRGPAYSMDYADIFEFHDIKISLKKWEIEIEYPHDEFEFPWDKPLAKEHWGRAGKYCMNDVGATEFLWKYHLTQDAFTARKILCTITGLPPINKTQVLGARFLFGNDKKPKDKFNWYDLAKEFPGYKYDKFGNPKSTYMGEATSEGGYVYADPGVYENVVVLDIASMHPHSLIAMNYFGPYTPKFAGIVKLRMGIKTGHIDEALRAFDSVDKNFSEQLKPFLENASEAKGLAHALKIIINMIYGMTSAPYPNTFKDPRNIDNCIAKRGALFMVQLKHEVQAKGYKVVHIKTDSIKIANGDQAIIDYCMKRAREYKYEFDHEHTYDRMALVNDAVLIAQIGWPEKEKGKWEAVGAQFAVPYIKKTLFTNEPVKPEDFAMLKQAKGGSIYINNKFVGKNAYIYPSRSGGEAIVKRPINITQSVKLRYDKPIETYLPKRDQVGTSQEIEQHRIERIAKEVKVEPEVVQGIIDSNFEKYIIDKPSALTGCSGYKWKLWDEFEYIEDVDMTYYNDLRAKAVDTIYGVGDGNIMFAGTMFERKNNEEMVV